VTFVLFLSLLIILLEIFVRHSPYDAPSMPGILFLWTYMPVGVVLAIGWIWDSYDLQIRVLTPWAVLNNNPTPAQDGLLLDYIGAGYFGGMWSAVRRRHYWVLLGYFGFWMAGIAGIVSTSLWAIEESLLISATPVIRTSTLDTSMFLSNSAPDYDYVLAYIGRQAYGIPRPRWSTTDDIVLESLSLPSNISGNTLHFASTTYGYAAALNCTEASASFHALPHPEDPLHVQFSVDYTANGCIGRYINVDSTTTGLDGFSQLSGSNGIATSNSFFEMAMIDVFYYSAVLPGFHS
jgi:hypothetical protein